MEMDDATLFAGGRLCLDFVNTACERRGVPIELLGDGDALRRWLRRAESFHERPLCPGDDVWSDAYAERVLPRALALRAAVRDLVMSVIEGHAPPTDALEVVNAALRDNPTFPQLDHDGAGFRASIAAAEPDDAWLGGVARDAAELLCFGDLSLLRQCECATCVRVFYDTTKNHRRKWCVEKCSSQTKAAAYYRRKKARAAEN